MIREYQPSDLDQILTIWLAASIQAHRFIGADYWESKVSDMRDIYLPASETCVYEDQGRVVGFYSLFGNSLAAIFVAPELQGQGIGSALLEDAKSRRETLQLTVYRENASSVRFYQQHGFCSLGEQVDEHTGHPELLLEFSPEYHRNC